MATATAARQDPYLSFQFSVEIKGGSVAGFSEVSGLDFESAVETFREGGELRHEQQLVGPTKFPSRIVLKRGVADSQELWLWHQEVTRGRVTRKHVSIVMRDSAGHEKRRWSFRDAVPVKWAGPQLRASSSEVAVETLELIHKGLA
jgi:phage tail-like protein